MWAISSATIQGHEALFYSGSGPPEGNTVCPACLGLISMGCYKRRYRYCSKSKGNRELWSGYLFGYLSWPYIDGQVSRSTPSRSTKQRFPYTNLPWALRFLPLCRCRIGIAFDTAIVLGPCGLRLAIFSMLSCWAGPGVPKMVTRKVMPMSLGVIFLEHRWFVSLPDW